VIAWLGDLAGGVGGLLRYGLAGGAFALAVLAFAARYHPSVRWPASDLAVLVFGSGLAVSAWTGSGLHHDRTAELERAQRELARWQAVAEEQAKQRERFAGVAFRQMQLAQERAVKLYDLQGIVDDYEDRLAAGDASACAADGAYTDSMRKIRVHSPGAGEAAGPGNGPGNPVP